MNHEIIIAGFGGQGILFAGRVLAYTGMIFDRSVSWLPSYGPEMRGGTANCHVILKEEPIDSPYVVNPNTAILLNKPSFDKFESTLLPGGKMIYDSTLIENSPSREDISYREIPATRLAYDIEAPMLANMIILGKTLKETGIFSLEQVFKALTELVPKSKEELLLLNQKALEKGFSY